MQFLGLTRKKNVHKNTFQTLCTLRIRTLCTLRFRTLCRIRQFETIGIAKNYVLQYSIPFSEIADSSVIDSYNFLDQDFFKIGEKFGTDEAGVGTNLKKSIMDAIVLSIEFQEIWGHLKLV